MTVEFVDESSGGRGDPVRLSWVQMTQLQHVHGLALPWLESSQETAAKLEFPPHVQAWAEVLRAPDTVVVVQDWHGPDRFLLAFAVRGGSGVRILVRRDGTHELQAFPTARLWELLRSGTSLPPPRAATPVLSTALRLSTLAGLWRLAATGDAAAVRNVLVAIGVGAAADQLAQALLAGPRRREATVLHSVGTRVEGASVLWLDAGSSHQVWRLTPPVWDDFDGQDELVTLDLVALEAPALELATALPTALGGQHGAGTGLAPTGPLG